MKRELCLGLSVCAVACAESARKEAPATLEAGAPFARLTAQQRAEFTKGLKDFLDVATPETGPGPVYNEPSGGACHVGPATAIGGSNARLVPRFGRWDG